MIKQLILVGLLASASLALASPTKGRRDDAPIKGEAPRVQQQLETTAETYQQQKLATEQQAPAKGRPDEAELAQRRVEAPAASKTSARAEQAEQRREEWTQQREEARGQQREEELGQQQQQVKEEAAPQQQQQQQQQQVREEASAASFFKQHYEAKTQAREEAPAKEAQRQEELEDKRASAKTSKPALEQQQKVAVVEESKVVVREQQQQQLRETHFEQQRLPELPQQQVELVSQQRDSEQIVQQQQQQRQEFDEEQRQAAGVKGQLAQAPVPETEPYAFEYSVEGSTRRETGDTKGVVRGQYSVANGDGSRRIVDYIADRDGFRASVVTNEFGTESRAPASVSLRSSQPSAEEISLRFEASKTSARDESGAAVKGQLVEQAPAQPAPVPATPPKPDNWNVAPAKGYAERIATVQTAAESASQQLEEPARLSAKGIEQQPLQQQQQQQAAPTKQISRLEETSLPAARKAYEEPRKAELPPLPLPQLQRSAEVVKSAELRQPKSIDLYASRVLPLTANARQPHQQHHQAQPHVRPVQSPSRNHQNRQLSQAGHHSPPLRAGAHRESSPATVGRHQQPAGGSVSRLVHQAPAHDQRAQAVRVSSYSSEEDAPLGFEAS